MAAAGGPHSWVKKLAIGIVLVAAASALHAGAMGSGWLIAALQALGGLLVVFASCELMILCVEGVAARLGWNDFVAGAIAGLASNLPEIVMLGFVIAKAPRVGFIVVALTLHTGALAFGIYSGLLPRDRSGHAALPAPMVKLATDLYAGAGGAFLATGLLMLLVYLFRGPEVDHVTSGLTATDLYVLGGLLLSVQVVATVRLVQRFSVAEEATAPASSRPPAAPPSVVKIASWGLGGTVTSLVGGHSVGEFADTLVASLRAAGYSEMFGALLLSVFACSGAIAMLATAHVKKMYDVALANVSGWMTQMAFLVMPVALILIGVFEQLGVTETLAGGVALPIDLQTTSVFVLGFPPLLVLWKAVQDDGKVSWVETTTMVCVFGLTIYFLALR